MLDILISVIILFFLPCVISTCLRCNKNIPVKMLIILNVCTLTVHLKLNCQFLFSGLGVWCLMVFNATFNNSSVISWWLVLLMEETGVPRENHLPQVTGKLYHIMLYEYTSPCAEIRTYNFSGDRH